MTHMLKAMLTLIVLSAACPAQTLPAKWEELTAPDFVKALHEAQGVCLLPFGIIEKHGPAGPLGTDLIMSATRLFWPRSRNTRSSSRNTTSGKSSRPGITRERIE